MKTKPKNVRLWGKNDFLYRLTIKTLFNLPKNEEYYEGNFNEMAQKLAQNLSYEQYVRTVSFSDDGMAYTSPWYTYDNRFQKMSNNYRDFVYSLYKYFGIKVAAGLFTKEFQNHVDINNLKTLKAVERVFFDSPYAGKWT